MRYLEESFPGKSTLITEQRNAHTVFDEVCRDFEEMSAELEKLKTNSSEADFLADVLETLNGLRSEICEHIGKLKAIK